MLNKTAKTATGRLVKNEILSEHLFNFSFIKGYTTPRIKLKKKSTPINQGGPGGQFSMVKKSIT